MSNIRKLAVMLGIAFGCPSAVSAQIVPDGTLLQNSVVTSQGNFSVIDGGTQQGTNLFHSFRQFSVSASGVAFFNNVPTIQNIFARVTGGSASRIDGWIQANGTANLFLLNPAGILFGPNARLNLGGAFIATTASSIQFADGTEFASNPGTESLLTISVPIGLGFGVPPGQISVQGTGHQLVDNALATPVLGEVINPPGNASTGLQVLPGRTIALVGGDVQLDNGVLESIGGHIELGAIQSGTVRLTQTSPVSWTFGYNNVSQFQSINLQSRSALNASGLGGGTIGITGGDIRFTGGSVALIQNGGAQPAGDITLTAKGTLTLEGAAPNLSGGVFAPSSLLNFTVGAAPSGDITVMAANLQILNGAAINTKTFSSANAGNINIQSGSLLISGISQFDPNFVSGIGSHTFASGRAGEIRIQTDQLIATQGGTIISDTFGTGNSGDVRVDANHIFLQGFGTSIIQSLQPSNILAPPSQISASTFGVGNAGNIRLNTQSLTLLDGGSVYSATFAQGNAGSIEINASDFVYISFPLNAFLTSLNLSVEQVLANPQIGQKGFRTLLAGTISSSAVNAPATVLKVLGLPPTPQGTSGSVRLFTGRLTLVDGASISVANEGPGNGGDILINAQSVHLQNLSSIAASTASGQGGNLHLNVSRLLELNHSFITASAQGVGNGGNIRIHSDLTALLQGSQISANANEGSGGRIFITSKAVFISPDSAITATSALGAQFNGVVQINTPDLDLSRSGFQSSSLSPPDPVTLCGGEPNTFTITGRSGFPSNPDQYFSSLDGWKPTSNQATSSPRVPVQPEIVEAQGWVRTSPTTVRFVVLPGNQTSQIDPPVNCASVP